MASTLTSEQRAAHAAYFALKARAQDEAGRALLLGVDKQGIAIPCDAATREALRVRLADLHNPRITDSLAQIAIEMAELQAWFADALAALNPVPPTDPDDDGAAALPQDAGSASSATLLYQLSKGHRMPNSFLVEGRFGEVEMLKAYNGLEDGLYKLVFKDGTESTIALRTYPQRGNGVDIPPRWTRMRPIRKTNAGKEYIDDSKRSLPQKAYEIKAIYRLDDSAWALLEKEYDANMEEEASRY